MVALLVLAVFAAIFAVVMGVIMVGQSIGAPKPAADAAPGDGESARWSQPDGPESGTADAFDWLTPVHAPAGLLAGESLSTISFWDSLLARLNGVEMMKQHLAQAGMRWTVGRLTMMMLLAGAASFAILLPMSWVSSTFAGFLSLGASACPYLMVLRRRSKRLRLIEQQFPDALDSLARSVRAGNALAAALELLAREAPQPLSGELRRTVDQRTLGGNWDQALEGLAARLPVPEISVFVGALQLQSRSGGKLHEVLSKLAETMRESAALKGEIRSISAHGKMTGGILTALPALIAVMMSYVNPQQMLVLWNDPVGNNLIWIAIGCLILAHFVIRKLVDIRI